MIWRDRDTATREDEAFGVVMDVVKASGIDMDARTFSLSPILIQSLELKLRINLFLVALL
jgi:hypothetical protein